LFFVKARQRPCLVSFVKAVFVRGSTYPFGMKDHINGNKIKIKICSGESYPDLRAQRTDEAKGLFSVRKWVR